MSGGSRREEGEENPGAREGNLERKKFGRVRERMRKKGRKRTM